MPYAEAMFLIDDYQSEAFELHVLLQQPVGTDQDVDLSGLEIDDGLRLLLRALEPGNFRDLDGPLVTDLGKAIGEGLVVLLGEQGGGTQHRHLFAVSDRDKSGAQSHFGFAEADVTAHKSIHRLAGAHVLDYRVDGGLLVRCFLETEAVGKGFHVVRLELELVTGAQGPLSVEMQQFGRGVVHLLGGLLLGLLPLAGTEGMQVHRFRVGAAVARDHMQLRNWHVERVAAGIFEVQEFAQLAICALAVVKVRKAHVATDAVRLMHHRITDAQLGQVAQPAFEIGAPHIAALPARAGGGSIQFIFGDESELRFHHDETAGDGCGADHEDFTAADETCEVGAGRGFQVVLIEVLEDGLAPPGRLGEQQDATAKGRQESLQRCQWFVGFAVNRDRWKTGCIGACFICPNSQHGIFICSNKKLFIGQEQIRRWQHRARAVAVDQLEAVGRVAPELGDCSGYVVMQQQYCIRRQVVKQRGGFIKKQRQKIFDTGRRRAVGDILVQAYARRITFESFAEATAKGVAPDLGHRKFARWQQTDFIDRIQRALAVHVEGAQGFDLVVEQFDAVGQCGSHREQIDQSAAHAVFAGGHHLRHMLVTGQRALFAQPVEIQLLALLEEEGVRGEKARRPDARQCRGRRSNQHIALSLGDRIQRRQSLRDQILMWREVVVGQGFPVRQQMHFEFGLEPGNFFLQALRFDRAGGNHGQQFAGHC